MTPPSDYVLHVTRYSGGNRLQALADLVAKRSLEWAPMFVYFSDTTRAKTFNKLLCEKGVGAELVIGDTKTKDRAQTLARIRSGKTLALSLCGCYNEGISVDELRTVIFGDLRHSDVNRQQGILLYRTQTT